MSENSKNMYIECEQRELQWQTIELKQCRLKVHDLHLACDAGMLQVFKYITGANMDPI